MIVIYVSTDGDLVDRIDGSETHQSAKRRLCDLSPLPLYQSQFRSYTFLQFMYTTSVDHSHSLALL